jgi:hypothetical protein
MRSHKSLVRLSDVKTSEFRGSKYPGDTIINPECYLELLLWLRESILVLKSSGLTEAQQVISLVSHLKAAAKSQFTVRYEHTDVASWTIQQAKENILALAPEHKAEFFQRALNMQFRASSLPTVIDLFRLYISNGEYSCNGSQFIFKLLCDKITQASPKILQTASARHNLKLIYDPEGTLDDLCTQAIKIALAVQVHFKVIPVHKRISEEEDPSKEVEVNKPKVSWDMRRNSTFADVVKGRRFNPYKGKKHDQRRSSTSPLSYEETKQGMAYKVCFNCAKGYTGTDHKAA